MANTPLNRLPCRRAELASVDPANYRIPIPNKYPTLGVAYFHDYLERAAPLFPDRRPAAVPRDVTPRSTLIRLATLVHCLGCHEPGLVRLILTFLQPYNRAVPILRPITVLHSAAFAQLRTAVDALPRGWQRRLHKIPERIDYLADNIPHNLLAIVLRIIAPDPELVTIRHEIQFYGGAPSTWHDVLLKVPAGTYPLPLVHTSSAGYLDSILHGIPLRQVEILHYWTTPESREHGNTIRGFNDMFRGEIGRLLFGAALTAQRRRNCMITETWPFVRSLLRKYNAILKQHT